MTSFLVHILQAKRRRGRTPTPGRYLGLRTVSGKIVIPSSNGVVHLACVWNRRRDAHTHTHSHSHSMTLSHGLS